MTKKSLLCILGILSLSVVGYTEPILRVDEKSGYSIGEVTPTVFVLNLWRAEIHERPELIAQGLKEVSTRGHVVLIVPILHDASTFALIITVEKRNDAK